MLYYLDSSAWVKRYFDEAGSGRVRHLFAQHETLGCSPLGLIEVGSTMARKRTAGDVKPGEFEEKRTSLLKDWRRFLRTLYMLPMALVHRVRKLRQLHPRLDGQYGRIANLPYPG
jgi:predicted nucleic acid-binding protein